VLIRGEHGTEKEQVARLLHGLGQGASGSFVLCHAGNLEEAKGDIENGDAGSASLGALIGAAQGGTLFLDGIDEMSPESQAALLRVLRWQELATGERRPPHRLELRIIGAACHDLRVQASAGRFRQELYQRLATVEISIPPLRERMEDLAELAESMLDRLAGLHDCKPPVVSAGAMGRLLKYQWPGNLRELENILRSAMLQSEAGEIALEHLPVLAAEVSSTVPKDDVGVKLQEMVERHVMRVLRDCGGNKVRAADRLGISRSTLYRMLDAGAMAENLR
jgi:DNA-binding NtrC family response regulator